MPQFSHHLLLIVIGVGAFSAGLQRICHAQADSTAAGINSMQSMLWERITNDPTHSDTWRLLGKTFLDDDRDQAIDCFNEAIECDPENAAAHFDLGQLLQRTGNTNQAAVHFDQVFRFAPHSQYADRLRAQGFIPSAQLASPIASSLPVIGADSFARINSQWTQPKFGDAATVGYEIESFDSANDLERSLNRLFSESPANWRGSIETGILYNSNVTLAPISRFVSNADAESAQWFINPNFEWTARRFGDARMGPIARGYFTLNEGPLADFNLASFQPGAFFERDISHAAEQRIARVEYSYSLDLFGGNRLGDRHTVLSSLMSIYPNARIDYLYASWAYSQFTADGSTPDRDSLDGPTYTFGAARFFLHDHLRIPTTTIGIDVEFADTEGSDFRYRSVRAYTDATIIVTERVSIIPSGAVGFRHFPDFSGAVDRDELTGRLGLKIRYQINRCTSISAVLNYDRFVSDNDLYDVDRLTTGVSAMFKY